MIVNPERPHQAEAKRRANVEIRKWNVVVMIIGPKNLSRSDHFLAGCLHNYQSSLAATLNAETRRGRQMRRLLYFDDSSIGCSCFSADKRTRNNTG
jgi:hypothetical protein